ncbi:MAG: hypothetical protein HYY76_16175 [Acidobacteria bacterium]|nr:hypothetical protein [Acidobacteriota bacterium]
MTQSTLKVALKRGALVAAANWPVTLIQASADSLFKLLLAAPLIGGVFLVALAVGSEPLALIVLDSREMLATVAAALVAQPIVLAAFLLAIGVVAVGGSLFVFLLKGGTVATLVRSEREAGPIEEPPLHASAVARASRFSVDAYVASAWTLFPRYARLGFILMAVYLLSALAYLAVVRTNAASGWGATAATTVVFALWITIVNLLYLLVQIVIAAEDCGVAAAARRVAAFLRHQHRHVAAVFALVLAIVIAATGASVLATAALGLVAFVPFFGLAALPLQLLAWLLRGLVFQYLGLASVGAYLKLYRAFTDAQQRVRPAPAYDHAWRPT